MTELFLLSGVSSTGKSTLLRQLRKGGRHIHTLPREIGELPLSEFVARNAMDIAAGAPVPDRLILHYDLFRPITFFGGQEFIRDPVLDLVTRFETVRVLTLWGMPDILKARAEARRRALWRKLLTPETLWAPQRSFAAFVAARARRARMTNWFDAPDRLWAIYCAWFQFLSHYPIADHWVGDPMQARSFKPLGAVPPAHPFWAANDR